LAGILRLPYPPNIRIIRVPCTGEVDIVHILRAFGKGVDGVLVGGCLKDQCHYIDGNYKAEERISFLKELLKAIGFEHKRLEFFFLSAAMGPAFAESVHMFLERVKELGPSPFKDQRLPVYKEKRAFFIDQIKMLSTKEADLVVEGIEGFGKIELKKEKCNGCGSCGNICEKAMKITDKNSTRMISYIQGYCAACRKCEEECEKNAIKVSEVFELRKILSLKEERLAEIELIACKSCGTMFAPQTQVNELEEELQETMDLCPRCKCILKAEKIHKMRLLNEYL
jgi:coenzyme F420-reducing hydrogenase delta subunit/Pyruvate/2-oxoacid:ferredoxin oxidoreductase delta subunit